MIDQRVESRKRHEAKLKEQLRAIVKAVKTTHGKERLGLEIKAEKLRHALGWCTERNPEIMGKETPCILRTQQRIILPPKSFTDLEEMIKEMKTGRLIREKRL